MNDKQQLLEVMVTTRSTWGMRVYEDGQVDEYSDQETRFADGDFVTRSIPPMWRTLTRLNPDELETLKSQLRESGYFELPSQLMEDRPVQDGVWTRWTVELDGRRHTVTARGPEAANHPILADLRDAVQTLAADALRRENSGE